MGGGLLGSALLHGFAVLLALLVLPGLTPPPPPVEAEMPIDLVVLGAATVSPQPRASAQPPHESAPAAPAAAPVQVRPPPARPQRPTVVPRPVPAPAEDFDTQLRAAERALAGHGMGDAAAVPGGAYGPHAATSIKDFIRAQIERRWNFDVAALGGTRWVVAIHVVLQSDGTVDSATIVEDPRYRQDPAYHALALSARNAVLVSSPLHLPAGTPPALRDMVLEFDPRAALR
jgi:hypothetical protein